MSRLRFRPLPDWCIWLIVAVGMLVSAIVELARWLLSLLTADR